MAAALIPSPVSNPSTATVGISLGDSFHRTRRRQAHAAVGRLGIPAESQPMVGIVYPSRRESHSAFRGSKRIIDVFFRACLDKDFIATPARMGSAIYKPVGCVV